jgi:hypothetical protein
LRTSHFSVAKTRLLGFLSEHRKSQPAQNADSIRMTFGDALKIRIQNLDDDPTLKPATRHYWRQVFAALLKSWPGLAEREVRRITVTDCREWARKFRKVASSTRYNNTISGLRHILDGAVEAAIIYAKKGAGNAGGRTRLEETGKPSNIKALPIPGELGLLQAILAESEALHLSPTGKKPADSRRSGKAGAGLQPCSGTEGSR